MLAKRVPPATSSSTEAIQSLTAVMRHRKRLTQHIGSWAIGTTSVVRVAWNFKKKKKSDHKKASYHHRASAGSVPIDRFNLYDTIMAASRIESKTCGAG